MTATNPKKQKTTERAGPVAFNFFSNDSAAEFTKPTVIAQCRLAERGRA